jgi:RAD50-interacting protein 1
MKRNLSFLQAALSNATFRRVWRETLEKLQDMLWSDILIRQNFTRHGAAQFNKDLQTILALVDKYIPNGSSVMSTIEEGATLLNLPLEAEENRLSLKQATDRIFTDNAEAKKALEELEIENITPAHARSILQRRVENSE